MVSTYLWAIRLETLLALLIFIMVVMNVNPTTSGEIGKIAFFSSLLFWVSGLYVLFLAWLRRFRRDGSETDSIGVSLRQGLFLGLFTVTLVGMQAMGILVWWDGLLVLAGFLFVELFFLLRAAGKM